MTEAAIDCLLLGAIVCAVVVSALLCRAMFGLAAVVSAAWALGRGVWRWVARAGRGVAVRRGRV